MPDRVERYKDIRFPAEILDGVRNAWGKNKAPGFFIRDGYLFHPIIFTKTNMCRPKERYGLLAFQMIVVTPYHAGMAHNDVGVLLTGKFLSIEKFEN